MLDFINELGGIFNSILLYSFSGFCIFFIVSIVFMVDNIDVTNKEDNKLFIISFGTFAFLCGPIIWILAILFLRAVKKGKI